MPAQVYLFTGPEFGERNDRIDAIKSELKKKFGEIDEFLFYATDVKISDVVNQLSSESFFSAGTCVVLKNAEVIKKKNGRVLHGTAFGKTCRAPSITADIWKSVLKESSPISCPTSFIFSGQSFHTRLR